MHAVKRVSHHADPYCQHRLLLRLQQICQLRRANNHFWTFLTLQSERVAVMHAGKRILVVDDSKPMTAFVTGILKEANYEDVDRIHDGVSALALLRKRKYDLVITDVQMQPISGLELARLIKADVQLQKVRIILTGSHEWDDAVSLDGVDGYVTKPFEPRHLKEKVDDVLATVAQLASG
jgi:two-component system chemotaxis response regulator CheY